jgi:hypothetical protein
MKKTIFILSSLFLFYSCQKEETGSNNASSEQYSAQNYPIINFNDQKELINHIGKKYDISRSNLYGIPEKYLSNSDELFGITPNTNSNFRTTPMQAEANFSSENSIPNNIITERAAAAYTYYNSYSDLTRNPNHNQTYNWDAYIYVENDGSMVAPADNDKVVFYALQVDFGNGQAAHTGLQWANGVKKVNWGGYWNGIEQPAANSSCGTLSCPYSWNTQTPYRFRVWRMGINYTTGKTQWGAWVKNMGNNQETFIGYFYSSSNNIWITGQTTWIETIKSGTTPLSNRNIQAVFSYLVYRDVGGSGPFDGAFQAYHAIAAYNDSETPPPSTAQNKNVSYTFDNIWSGVRTKSIRHKFNTVRTVAQNTYLW